MTGPIDPDAMPEPYGSLLAFLADLDEQVQAARFDAGGNEFVVQVLDQLQAQIVGLGLIVTLKAKS